LNVAKSLFLRRVLSYRQRQTILNSS
jgi:hypothetical protein